jgi:mercuric ion transport protein
MKQLQLANVGGLAAAAVAVVASSCCAIPMALAFMGVSTGVVGILGPLHELRPIILGVAVLLLVAGWIYTFRARAAALRSGNCPRGRFRLNFIVLTSASALIVVALTWQIWDPVLERLVMRAAQ